VTRDSTLPRSSTLSLVVGVGSRTCALAASYVLETMRPLPVEPLAGMPPFVLGLSIIRGGPVPVIHLGRLLGGGEAADAVSRFVTLRLGDRKLALAVRSVLGLRELDLGSLVELPTILGDESARTVEAVGSLDAGLLVVLRAMRILPEPLWGALTAPDATP